MADPLSLRRIPASAVALSLTALVLTLTSWPLATLEPNVGLDPSWRSGLLMAAAQGLDFGPEAMFSFGPLGFLRADSVYTYPWPTRLAFTYTVVVQFLLCLVALWALRRNFGSLLVAAPVALVITALIFQEPIPVIVFGVLVGLLREDLPARLEPAIVAGMGVLVGVQLLAKLNTGIAVAALCAIALLALAERRRRIAIAWFAGGLTIALAAGWALTGQSLSGIPEYVRGSLEVISGYSDSMGYAEPGREWELWAALLLWVLGLVILLRDDPLGRTRVKLAIAAMWLVLGFTAFKAGFVRHDAGHSNIYFATILGGFAVLSLERLPRVTSALVLTLATMALLASFPVPPSDLVEPLERSGNFLREARTIADPSELNAKIVAARQRVAATYALEPKIFDALKGHPAHVDPYELNILWAYRLPWKPVPVFQSYAAYTAGLDERNAEAFASAADGPERVLRHNAVPVDGRNAAWESPAAMRAMLCHFRVAVASPQWHVLRRVPNRCGAPRLLRDTRARMGQEIAVPPSPDRRSAVYVELDGVAVSGLERIVSTLYRPAQRAIVLNGGERGYRLMPDTAANGLILRVPRALDYPVPLRLDQAADRFVVTAGAGDDRKIRARFYAVGMS